MRHIKLAVLFIAAAIVVCTYLTLNSQENLDYRSAQWELVTEHADFPVRSGHSVVEFKNKLWLVGGWDGEHPNNDVWMSKDGIKWKRVVKNAPFCDRAGQSVVAFRNKLWLIGGLKFDSNNNISDLNDIWSSSDGKSWQCVTPKAKFAPRGAHSTIVYKNRLWLIGGLLNRGDVWSTSDGVNWSRSRKNAPFQSRAGHSTCVFQGKMWVIGGFSVDRNNQYHSLNDVWYTENGIKWIKTEDNSSFHVGGGHTSVSYNNMLWIMGGFRAGGTVYNSSDGANWEKIKNSDQFGDRVAHSSVVFKNKIWIIGGYDGSGHKNDIWCSSMPADKSYPLTMLK